MSLSTSADHTTAVLHHEPRWDPPRRGFGIAGLCLSGCGLAIFIYYFSTHANSLVVTGHAIGWAALAVALTPSGLIVGRWGFGSQRAADTKRAFIEDIIAIYDRVEDLGEKVDALTALNAEALHAAPPLEPRVEEPAVVPAQQHAPKQRRRRGRREAEGATGATDNVVRLPQPPSEETMRAARGLASRFLREQRKREDRTEDN